MMQEFLSADTLMQQINWLAPWYRTLDYHGLNNALAADPMPKTVSELLNASVAIEGNLTNYSGQAICFVPQAMLPPDTGYEAFIAATGCVPTRDNFHDLLGGLIWLNFPQTKAALNRLHEQDIAQYGIGAARTRLRHILTLFDENGAVIVSQQPALLSALQNFDWQTAFWQQRQAWQSFAANEVASEAASQVFIVGHALLEKLIQPWLGICAHSLLVYADASFFALPLAEQRRRLDKFLAALLLKAAADWTSRVFQPLPLLGVPSFTTGQDIQFYQNTEVFRPPRAGKQALIFNLTA